MSAADRRAAFRALHERGGVFLLANAWDTGSAKLLAAAGVEALATTSSGLAWTLGKHDQQVTLEELLGHVSALAVATDLPLSVDSERCYADTPAGVAETVRRLADAGAAGCSIEDYDPATGRIDDVAVAAERVAAAAKAAREEGVVLTARAENHLYDAGDLDDTVARLVAYREAGADVVYAPGLTRADDIRAVVEAADGTPVNVLLYPQGPSIPELAELGVRRVSVGGGLASVAYGAAVAATRALLAEGHYGPDAPRLSAAARTAAFG
jgi:2-methylisocitrate lyase-like PEP mutase family enzyme